MSKISEKVHSSENERSLLIGLREYPATFEDVVYSIDELKLLVQNAGGEIVDSIIIRREKFDPTFIIGRGHVDMLKERISAEEIDIVIFDINNIKPSQVRNLEKELGCRVIGRSEVILDIFAKRAKSSEAQIQVELAQLNFMLPRLRGFGTELSRLGGGIGTRGPGEKMLETDKRHIQRRILKLKKDLEKFEKHRELTRKSRVNQVSGAVTGYTNAGKSTLINKLSKEKLFAEDMLFATLDAYTRTMYLSEGKSVLLTDTVGFIRNLPTHLVASFKSTLEEITYSDFVIHVVDINAIDIEMNIKTVEDELSDLKASEKPRILFFNKCDTASEERIALIKGKYPDAIVGSAITEAGIQELKLSILNTYESFRIS